MKFYIERLGCRVNQFDSFSLEQTLLSNAHEKAENVSSANVVFLFGCMVTENAVKQARQIIRKIQRENPDARIYVSGCYARLDKEEIINLNVNPLPDWEKKFGSEFPVHQPRSRAYLKIQDGCSNKCKYCIIRIARGKSTSLPEDKVVENAIVLSKNYSEITLCGIHIGDYGKDLENTSLSQLLERLMSEVPNVRFRLSSLHPHEVDEKLISLWGNKNICRHLHLSIQSGSDSVLERMGRRPARKMIENIITRIYEKEPNTFISADLIVGYPFETESEFDETVSLIESQPFSWLHVFPFSPRKGTEAENLPLLNNKIVKQRVAVLLDFAKKARERFIERQIGKELEVVVTDSCVKNKKKDSVKAVSDNYIVINLPNDRYSNKGIAIVKRIKGTELWGSWK